MCRNLAVMISWEGTLLPSGFWEFPTRGWQPKTKTCNSHPCWLFERRRLGLCGNLTGDGSQMMVRGNMLRSAGQVRFDLSMSL